MSVLEAVTGNNKDIVANFSEYQKQAISIITSLIHQGIDDGKIDDSISFDVIFNWIQIIILAFEKNG